MKIIFKLLLIIGTISVVEIAQCQKRIKYEELALKYFYNNFDSLKPQSIDSIFFSYTAENILSKDFFTRSGYLRDIGFVYPKNYLFKDSMNNVKIVKRKIFRLSKKYLSAIAFTNKTSKINLIVSRRFYFSDNVYIKIIIKENSWSEKFVLLKYSDNGEFLKKQEGNTAY